MKKILYLSYVIMLIIVLASGVCYAGSVPEDILESDNAKLYFGEIIHYHENTKTAVLTPVKKIKGDVVLGSRQTIENCHPIGAKGLVPKPGEVCLIAYYDDINPIYIFKVTSDNLSTLKIKNVEGMDMWKRLQTYINEGDYTQAEIQRNAGQNSDVQVNTDVQTPPAPFVVYIAFFVALLLFVLIKKIRKLKK